MNNCKECELAVYCYSEPCGWMFRTMEEMREKQQKMAACPLCPQSQADFLSIAAEIPFQV